MNREQAKQLLPIIQAFADGETIQFKDEFGKWFDVASWTEPMFRGKTEYRIKPKPLEAWAIVDCDGEVRGLIHRTRKAAQLSVSELERTRAAWCPYRVVHMREVSE